MSPTTTLAKVAAADVSIDDLRTAGSRADAARIVGALAAAADGLSREIIAAGPADPSDEDTARDPLAWAEIATQLTRMSAALNNGVIHVEDMWENELKYEWADLAHTTTRREFAAAWAVIKEKLSAKADSDDSDAPQLREFAVTQVIAVAAAVMDGRW